MSGIEAGDRVRYDVIHFQGVRLCGFLCEDLGEHPGDFLGLGQRALHLVHVELDPICLRDRLL